MITGGKAAILQYHRFLLLPPVESQLQTYFSVIFYEYLKIRLEL